MLTNTFCHIPGITTSREEKLWEADIFTWDDFLREKNHSLSTKKLETAKKCVEESQIQLALPNPVYFSNKLNSALHWRLFSEFQNNVAYIDIETTGLSVDRGAEITTIALYNGKEVKTFVNGDNLTSFPEEIEKYPLIISYNGKCFDIPFIKKYFNIEIGAAHIDLRYVMRRLGYSGGLKGCEKALGLDREELNGIDGYFAILLWKDYLNKKNEASLETLLAYNIADVVNLEQLMHIAYNRNIENTPFQKKRELKQPKPPKISFKADLQTVHRIMSSHHKYRHFV